MSNLLLLSSTYPSLKKSFESSVSHLGLVYDFLFGSGASAGSGQTAITNNTELATWFDAYSQNAGTTVINREWQRYQPITDTDNFYFAADALELRATLPNGNPTGTSSASPTSDVNYDTVVPLASTSSISVGQVAGLGEEHYANLHATYTYSLNGTLVTGDTVTLTIVPRDGSWSPVVISATAGASDTITTLAASMVSQINAHATLQANNIRAYVLTESAGGYALTFPKRSITGNYPETGTSAKGSVRWLLATAGVTGTILHSFRSYITATYVVSKTSNSVTINHPVTLTTGSVITFSPTRLLVCTVNAGTAVVPVAAGMEAGVTVGQAVQLSYADPNLRRVTAVASGAITLNGTVYPRSGQFIAVYSAYEMVASAASTGTTLASALVPSGVEVGMYAGNLYSSGYGFASGAPQVVSKTSTTVTLSSALSVAVNDTVIFYHAIDSAQIWSKFLMAPNMDGRTYLAGELVTDIPNAAVISAWPAFWCYTATSDPNPTPGGSGASEVDFTDTFNYWNNNANNQMGPANSGGGANIYYHPDFSTSGTTLTGNNIGMKERKIQFILTPNRAYYYLDGLLIRCCKFTWNTYKRAQFAANLATGCVSSSPSTFNSNGFFPIDVSQFPMKFRIKRMRFWSGPNSAAPM